MENMLLATAAEGANSSVFMLSAAVYLVCSFLIVYFLRTPGNKLMLLGLLTMLAGLVFAASMPSVAKLSWVMAIIGGFLVFHGATKSSSQ